MIQNILRKYDIRGKYPTEINEDVAYQVGLSFGSFLKEKDYKNVVIGKDVRLSSNSLYKNVLKGLSDSSIDVIEIRECTTPICAYATLFFKTASLMVTASHNPKNENGFKFFLKDNISLCGDELQTYYDYLNKGKFLKGKGKITYYNLEKDYIKEILHNLHIENNNLKVIVDPGNGATALIADKIFSKLNINYKIICDTPDGNFPNHHPDPSVEENLEMLKKEVIKEKADLGVSYDGDGDRIGVVLNNGKYISADILMIIFVKNILSELSKKDILFDVKCSLNLKKEILKLGGNPILYKTGASFVKNKINKDKILFGGEYSGHLVFNDKYLGIDDGIYSSLRLIEILANNKKPLTYYLDDIIPFKNTPEIKIATPDNIKFKVIDKICEYCQNNNISFIDIDGLRIEENDYMVSLRASNTGPNLTLRIEALTEKQLNELQEKYLKLINDYKKELL